MNGARFGAFVLDGLLAKGGMGEVYRARHHSLGSLAVVKLLPDAAFADATSCARFLREAEAMALVRHTSVAKIYDVGRQGNHSYIAMELVEGRSLDALVNEGGLPLEEVASIGAQLAEAVAAIHALGLIHRDLKPANVMLTPRGRVVLVDLGIAKRLTPEELRLTQSGAFLGTPGYWSPEQASGLGHAAGPACDVFSLGALIFALATGEPPFPAPSLVAAAISTRENPTPLVSRVVPRAQPLDAVLEHAMHKDPALRIEAAELARRLRALSFSPTSQPKTRSGWVLAGGAALCLVAASVALTRLPARPQATPSVSAVQAAQAQAELDALVRRADALFDEDPPEALALYRRAAEAGHLEARANLGVALLRGLGVEADLEEGLKWLVPAAEDGDPDAMAALGRHLAGAEETKPEALRWLRAASELKNVAAQVCLGQLLLARGAREEALLLLREAEAAGDGAASFLLGRELCTRWLASRAEADRAAALEHMKRAVEAEVERAYVLYAELLFAEPGSRGPERACAFLRERAHASSGSALALARIGLRERSFAGKPAESEVQELLLRALEAGQTDALAVLRESHLTGLATSPPLLAWLRERHSALPNDPALEATLGLIELSVDAVKGLAHLKRAAGAGNATAMFDLACAHAQGRGVPVDKVEAQRWFLEAAKRDERDAFSPLIESLLVDERLEEAERWARRGVALGDDLSPISLARVLLRRGGAERQREALRLLLPREELPEAGYALTLVYRLGRGVPVDRPRALGYATRAAARGCWKSKAYLGQEYLEGVVVQADHARARRLFTESATSGYAPAMYGLATLLLDGVGGPRDRAGGRAWLERAAAAGFSRARRRLERERQR